ncbi:hypothetical protein MtrunA17_Chr6g0455271 [Medicago truncatula]|uniref:RALF n=1 Tax=Medicago truncatula TaxID=3880 RepID=A0A396HG14_MEDTR|nr:hypothetical protein MtrunA17_Chr6g0455271 [Medicago truncatula]
MMNKGVSLLFLILLIQLHLSKTTSLKIKGCTSEDCLINNDLESEEFSMSSHAARMLLDLSQTQTGRNGNSNGAAVKCPINQAYRTCLPSQNGGGPNNSGVRFEILECNPLKFSSFRFFVFQIEANLILYLNFII